MEATDLEAKLEDAGELMVLVEEFDEPLELHLHDTEFDGAMVTLDLADGELEFSTDRVAGVWKHSHSLAHYDL